MFGWGGADEPGSPDGKKKGQKNDPAKLQAENDALKAEIARLKSKSAPKQPTKEEAAARGIVRKAKEAATASSSSSSPPKPRDASPPGAAAAVRVGQLLMVDGLVKRPELNGRLARVVAHDPSRDTWSTVIEGEPKRFALKTANLVPPPKGAATYQPAELVQQLDKARKKKTATTSRTPRKQPDESAGGGMAGGGGTGSPAVASGWNFKPAGEGKAMRSSRSEQLRSLSPTEREEIRQRLVRAAHTRRAEHGVPLAARRRGRLSHAAASRCWRVAVAPLLTGCSCATVARARRQYAPLQSRPPREKAAVSAAHEQFNHFERNVGEVRTT